VRETAEEPVVAKTARVIEEVVVGKESTTRTETVNDTVRGTKVEVERVAGEDPQLRPDASTKKTQ
jgi:stress response protein YsnF